MRALIAMSGGVDSSVAAFLMQQEYECGGCTMHLRGDLDCPSADLIPKDIGDARAIADKLGIPFYVFDFREKFQKYVIDQFVHSYELGVTPNPCISCNRFLKFGAVYDEGRKLGFDIIATGHYARIEQKDGEYFLKKGLDPAKDQSYVLYTLTQEQLSHTRFPLGELSKAEVRDIAESHGFINARKKDSQDICFVPDRNYAGIIEEYTGRKPEPGDFVDEDGKVLGRHRGIIHYTVGQHRGLGLPTEIPLYVKRIDAGNNRIILALDDALYEKTVTVKDFNWISGRVPDKEIRGSAKIRYRHREQPCFAEAGDDGTVFIHFDEAQRAPTPGQSCVLYDGDTVLGGGIIAKT